MAILGLLPVKIAKQGVYPRNVDSEPSVFPDRLATKRQYEFAKRVPVKRQAYVEEIDVGVVVFPRPGYGFPNGHEIGVE